MVIDSRTENVLQRVSEVTQGQGAYAAFDAIGGTASQQILSAVRDEGTMVVYGVLSGLTMQTGAGKLWRNAADECIMHWD